MKLTCNNLDFLGTLFFKKLNIKNLQIKKRIIKSLREEVQIIAELGIVQIYSNDCIFICTKNHEKNKRDLMLNLSVKY